MNRKPFNPQLKYEHPDLGDGNEVDPHAAMEMATAKWTGELLDRDYPGHPWSIKVTGGVIMIQLAGIMPDKYWNIVKIFDVLTDPGGKRTVLKAAGELLERYNIPRRGFSENHWRDAMNAAPIIGRGNIGPLR